MPYAKAHAPIYGYLRGAEHTIPLHLVHYARTVSVLKLLNGLRFDSVINVGGADGMQSKLVADLFGVPVVTADLTLGYLQAGNKTFGLPCVCANGQQLPFADNSFGLALCVETVEHVDNPAHLCAELARVARAHVVLSTESYFESPEQRTQFLTYIRETHPQFFRTDNPVRPSDRHHFTAKDLADLFPQGPVSLHPQFDRKRHEINAPIAEVRELVRRMTAVTKPSRAARVIAHCDLGGGMASPRITEDDILRAVVRDTPMLPLKWDQQMREEDQRAQERTAQWEKLRHRPAHIPAKTGKALTIEEPGAQDMTLTWLTADAEDNSPPFCMRRVKLAPGGTTPRRCVSWERQLYVISGQGSLHHSNETIPLNTGDSARVPAGVSHSIHASQGSALRFLDVVESITSHFGR